AQRLRRGRRRRAHPFPRVACARRARPPEHGRPRAEHRAPRAEGRRPGARGKMTRDPRVVLREAGLSPKRSFGQSFLVAEPVVRAIAGACVPDAEVGAARVVEIGAGTGALTSRLVERARHVVAIERDRDLVPVLAKNFDAEIASKTLDLVEGDAQAVDYAA